MLDSITASLKALDPSTIKVTDEGLGPWSISTLKLLEKCPLQFFITKVLKVKPPEVLTEDSYVTYVGRAAHTWLEDVSLGKTLEEGYEKAREKHYHEVTEKYWYKVDEVRGSIAAFKNRIDDFKVKHGDVEVFPELKLGITKDLRKTGFFSKDVYFRGIIDMPVLIHGRDLMIIDHKLGGGADWGLRNYTKQLYSQKVLFHFGRQEVRGAQAGIHFIQNSEVCMGEYRPKEDIENVYARELFMDIKDAVANVNTEGKFKHGRGTQCKYCNFRSVCEGGKRGTAGQLQPIVEESAVIFK